MSLRKGGEMRVDPFTGDREWWTREDLAMENLPRCDRCGLQLPHEECIPESAIDIVQSRRTEGSYSLMMFSSSRRKAAD